MACPPTPPSKLAGQISHIRFLSHFNSPSLLDFRFKFRVFLHLAADSPSNLSSLQNLYLIPNINHTRCSRVSGIDTGVESVRAFPSIPFSPDRESPPTPSFETAFSFLESSNLFEYFVKRL